MTAKKSPDALVTRRAGDTKQAQKRRDHNSVARSLASQAAVPFVTASVLSFNEMQADPRRASFLLQWLERRIAGHRPRCVACLRWVDEQPAAFYFVEPHGGHSNKALVSVLCEPCVVSRNEGRLQEALKELFPDLREVDPPHEPPRGGQ